MALSWKEALQAELKKVYGASHGQDLFNRYHHAFSNLYSELYTVPRAVADIKEIETLADAQPLRLKLKEARRDQEGVALHFCLFKRGEAIALSDLLPIFECLDLRTQSALPLTLTLTDGTVSVTDLQVTYARALPYALDKVERLLEDALLKVYDGQCENDGLNKLILGAEFSWREVVLLRAYLKYLQQTGFRASPGVIETTLLTYAAITQALLALFKLRFDPTLQGGQDKLAKAQKKLEQTIREGIETITNLDEDRIMRRFWQLIQATLRTNYYQAPAHTKDVISLKLYPAAIPELPLPLPLYEIFVYSPRFEATHLRSAKVARGGIRWSERRDDFRTEILGLMKAQKVKNAIIVPSGAKGGFVVKTKLGKPATRDEGVACYCSFMQALLSLTDNLVGNKVVRPKDTVCYDEADPYLVVAADKGTASFSDIANRIAEENKFWLHDAFASGGSHGYDHKKIGITARGAWESIRRHFRELNRDVTHSVITVVGIGDMSGDVFGNGMIESDKLKLVAAFDHRHIFIDPNPDPSASHEERLRLFRLPTSSWADYNPKLISRGGGVYARSSKSIALTAQLKNLCAITDDSLTPNELIRALLRAPVDLLYNGGIGTYVKASYESNADVGDKATELCRINGNELRAKVVGEGGNLGFTQHARVEYALQGGLINTDFIDNSAGVDCSDHEVNIKIVLNKMLLDGKMSEKKRDALLRTMTDDVAALVLQDNYAQALALSFSAAKANHYAGLYQQYLKLLETQGVVDRVVEGLPDDKELTARRASGIGLTRPELAVLLAYTKIHLKREIVKTSLPEDAFFKTFLARAFPTAFYQRFKEAIDAHRLKNEIIATELSNALVNEMGITFIYRLQTETGADVEQIIRAYTLSRIIFDATAVEDKIDKLGTRIAIELQYELLHYVRNLLNLSTRWFLRSAFLKQPLEKTIAHFSKQVTQLKKVVPKLIVGATKTYLHILIEKFIQAGYPRDIANTVAIYRALYTSLNIIEVAGSNQFDLLKTAMVYFDVGAAFDLVWFRDQIGHDSREGHWNALARLHLRDELDLLQKLLTLTMIVNAPKESNAHKLSKLWLAQHAALFARWQSQVQLLQSNELDYTAAFIVVRELYEKVYTDKLTLAHAKG